MKLVYVVGLLMVIFLIGAGCKESAETSSVCPAGQSMIEEKCCADGDTNGVCDDQQFVTVDSEAEVTEPKAEETQEAVVEEVTEFDWDTSKVSVEGYTCGNKTISINLKNNLDNSVTIEGVRLGTTFGKGIPFFIRGGKTEDVDIPNPSLLDGKEIDESLVVTYKDLVTKKTFMLGPKKLEGIC